MSSVLMSPCEHKDVFTIDTDPSLFTKFPGLTTVQAINSLYEDILEFREENCNREKKSDFYGKILKSSFHYASHYTTFSWIPLSITILILSVVSFLTSSQFVVIVIALLTIINIAVVLWDNHSRFNEFKARIDYVLKMLKKIQQKMDWQIGQFPNLYTPHSPSVSLQWTIRDGHLINLPNVLLAKGDIIIMRPGHVAPADVETVLPPPSQDNKYSYMVTDQLLACDVKVQTVEITQSETLRSVERPPIEDRLYVVTKAPYVAQLKAITNKYLEKPTSLYDRARYLLFGKCLHHVILPTCFILCEILATIRWYILPLLHCRVCSQFERWVYFYVTETSSVLITLISLIFPVFWSFSNAVGNALLQSRFIIMNEELEKQVNKKKEAPKKSNSSYYDDLEASLKTAEESDTDRGRKRYTSSFVKLLTNYISNNGTILARSTNFVHTMASVTVICCVDKKGILSFPNPIAEKIFFLKNITDGTCGQRSGEINNDGRQTIDEEAHKVTTDSQNEKPSKIITPSVEILDLTPRDEKGSAWKIEFDDSRWHQYLSSLKPIGLAILLNTCNRETHKSYSHFCAHITSHAIQNKHLVPVANRRCLCELARQIGFHESVVQDYTLELQLFTYKNLAGNKYVEVLFKTRKPKFPFPHAMSVIVSNAGQNNRSKSNTLRREEERKRKRTNKEPNDKQMFNQGTVDVILDYCVDYWDGYHVHPLTPGIRKKILDFYQRSSLTAYCTAFSYRPIYKNLNSIAKTHNSAVYIELLKSIDSRQRQRRRERRRQRLDEQANENSPIRRTGTPPSVNVTPVRGPYFREKQSSAVLHDVVECDEEAEETIEDNIHDYDENINECTIEEYDEVEYSEESDEEDAEDDMELEAHESHKPEKIDDNQKLKRNDSHECTVNYFQDLGKQIFLGMISMQYQPLIDMVQMIEELEKACIRFVHFSKENELRSRVFSEKMGLESGWNCHISLLPEADSNQLVEGFRDSEGVSVGTDLEISSTVETGASSADDDENVPFAFYMSNRAKLPCGIRNIRPHLEQVDNVPLLVSLFTDCTPETTEQMLAIMQEYGQVVCVLGSSANIKNFGLFAQADASISVEPLYAQVCQQIPSSTTSEKTDDAKCLSPIELSQELNSLLCSLILQRNYNYQRILPIYPLIADSRNLMRLIWNCCQFWLCCVALTLTVQMFALVLLLPGIFTLEQALWISVVVTPCLSISLATAPYDDLIMNKTKGKDWLCSVNWTTIRYALTCYGSKLLCGVFTILTSYIMQLMAICSCLSARYGNGNAGNTSSETSNKKHCVYVFILFDSDDKSLESEYINTLDIVRCHMALILSLNLVSLCLSFLHRDTVCWKRLPRVNFVWLVFVFFPLSLQVIHFVLLVNYWSTDCLLSNISLLSVRSLILTLFSPCLTYIISEIVKIYEIRINERYQRKVRLEFGTKLGMNSPF